MKMTLLEIVQNILSAMDSDEVNSISDTVESNQVAEIVKETYYEQFNGLEIPQFRTAIRLDGLGDLARPNYMLIPDNVSQLEWVKYQDDGRYRDVAYCSPDAFFDRVLQNTLETDNVQLVTDISGVQYYIKNNKSPHFYTSMDDKYCIFDSYDNTQDSTLQDSKCFAFGQIIPTWEMADEFVPELDASLFPLLLAEAKSVSFVNLKQTASSKEEQRARRQRIRMQNNRHRDAMAQKRSYDGPNFARTRP